MSAPPAAPRVAVVTDSTASLPADLVAAHDLTVVPLQVVVGADAYDEGSPEATPEAIAAALRDFRPVSTSRPAPEVLREVYRRLAAQGADQIVSVHLSGDMSGTFESAQVAARDAAVPVVCVDSRQVGVATGYAALAAARAVAAGATAEEAGAAARHQADACASFFYVDTLEYLRRGGRIGAAAALLGGALAVKPLLTIDAGVVSSLERVRTSGRALARLAELAVAAAGEAKVDVCVAHLASPERAATLAASLADRLAEQLDGREVWCAEVGAVLGAHVGPGMIAVCVASRLMIDVD
ncbi:DegV family protein [Nocardioides rubriscoriae]|uniref:DegV family protein n=1 Tax=Nocardioides rubriscoriae TaxID=642762 RepID=UPI0011DF9BA8|nr:DegV family protein [Nocardioides rubriscoriae]